VIKRYCDERAYQCVRFDEIGVSRAEDPFERPVFRAMVEAMKGFDVKIVVAESIDRVCADPEH
jgi:DNA invertase Pin-like site-specific DNA recombinase